MDELKEIVTWRIRRLDKVRRTPTMMVIEKLNYSTSPLSILYWEKTKEETHKHYRKKWSKRNFK